MNARKRKIKAASFQERTWMHLKRPEDVQREGKMSKKPKLESTTRTWIAKPVLAPELTEDPHYFEVYVGILKDRKTTSKAIQSISVALPGFNHLKRCSNQKILLCPRKKTEKPKKKTEKETEEKTEEETEEKTEEEIEEKTEETEEEKLHEDFNLSQDEVKSLLEEKGFDVLLLEDKLEIISVPSKAPKTKLQATMASKVWPVNFHPDIRLESIISGKEFDDNHLASIEKCMRVTIEAARRESVGNKNCTGSAMIVDPESGNILALAAAKINLHPMGHASMLAIDLVAKLQGGGVWELNSESIGSRKSSEINSMTHDDNLEKKRKFTESIPLCYPTTLSDLTFPVLEPFMKTDSTEQKKYLVDDLKKDSASLKTGPYLCTGYWVFLLQEPCPLCAMALLHSRVSKIFYGRANIRSGVLGSKTVLHSLPGLNHRYQVWRGILESECTQMSESVS